MDDADMRLTPKAIELGLADKDRGDLLASKKEAIDRLIHFTRNYSVKPQLMNEYLESLGTTPLRHGCKLVELINRPQLTFENIANQLPELKEEIHKIEERREEIIEAAEIQIKYQGYIEREKLIADKILRLENIKIKDKFNYEEILSLSTEARQKLSKINPETIAQASRIPGVSPSDINVLVVLASK
jgi:tRNA uridine 5-carboxymethylaminomethyl modification enzyme